MAAAEIRGRLAEMLRKADRGELPRGWLYLSSKPLTPTTEVLLLQSEKDLEFSEGYAASLGFPHEGLETDDLVSIVQWTRELTLNPTDEELSRSFEYYLRFDAFMPALDAADPPPAAEIMARLDREFYASLGEERPNTKCRREECDRGAVPFSIFCRRHHFESIKGRPWPYAD